MGYILKQIKAPKQGQQTGWFVAKAGFPAEGGEKKAAFFGDVKEEVSRRADEWLMLHQPIFQISVREKPTLSIVRSNV